MIAERIPELKNLSAAEKLILVEEWWDDLRQSGERKSPEWHRELLEERERRIEAGEARFVDWEKAQEDIRRRVERS